MGQIPKKLIEKKTSEILQKRQRNGILITHKTAEEEAKKSLESCCSRQKYRCSLVISNIASSFWKWTGISEKKGWDVFQLLITACIPVVIFLGTRNFNEQQQEIATARYQQETLTKYFEQMSQLLLDENLRREGGEARTIARARTLSTLRELDDDRKGLLIKFLAEAQLISKEKPVISLVDADLSRANLSDANPIVADFGDFSFIAAKLRSADLSRANLSRANLSGANLSGAYLIGANLSEANLSPADLIGAKLSPADLSRANLSEANLGRAYLIGANLSNAKLIGANLSEANLGRADLSRADLIGADLIGAHLIGAYLIGAHLSEANLSRADLIGANLSGANLSGANLSRAENLSNQLIKSTCFWEKAIYTNAEWNKTERKWIAIDEKANQKKIEEIKQDKASEPKNSPDCKIWEWRTTWRPN